MIGEAVDLANAAWYAAEGDYLNASLSAASAIPFLGYAAVGAKYAIKGTKLATKGTDAVRGVVKASDDIATAVKGSDEAAAVKRLWRGRQRRRQLHRAGASEAA